MVGRGCCGCDLDASVSTSASDPSPALDPKHTFRPSSENTLKPKTEKSIVLNLGHSKAFRNPKTQLSTGWPTPMKQIPMHVVRASVLHWSNRRHTIPRPFRCHRAVSVRSTWRTHDKEVAQCFIVVSSRSINSLFSP